MSLLWLRGLLGRRRGRLLTASAGVAMAVALLASIGSFLHASQATMTSRTAANVAADWQVEAQPHADPKAMLAAVAAHPAVATAVPVGFGVTSGLSATTAATTQTTGPGFVIGLPDGYSSTFPQEIRVLIGDPRGASVAQQTAANLHVRVGDTVQIGRAGLPPVAVTVSAIIDLPQSDTLFQKVGAAKGSQPSAPPDNVIVLPLGRWHQVFDPLAAGAPDQVRYQAHVRLKPALPNSPADAFDQVTGAARNLESRLAGAGLVGDNLGAALDAARADAAYAGVMFLFLGLPGAVLAGILTAVVAAAGGDRRRREQALLRSRGATVPALMRLALIEAGVVGLIGSAAGLLLALGVGKLVLGSTGFGSDLTGLIPWAVTAAAVGMTIAALVVVLPGWRDARRSTIARARLSQRRLSVPAWAGIGLGVVLLGGAIAGFIATSRQGYHLVLAPEGVPSISVDYLGFAGPALLWLAAAVLTWRIADLALNRGRAPLARMARPMAGPLAGSVAASMSRQRRVIAPALVLVALTTAFASSTAVFNATYAQQAEADARLTNGADVTVTQPPGAIAAASMESRITAVPGVQGVEPLLHRFAYVGADLQDLYGVRATTMLAAGRLQDAYFQGGTAAEVMKRLSSQPDGILVSAETVKDFQLQAGDHLSLRLQDQRTHQSVPVVFHYVGIVKEFPTAPRDSFLLANGDYVSRATGDASVSAYLIDSGSASPADVATATRQAVGTGPVVTDISTTRRIVGSSLTAVDLNGLTRVELGFALVFAVSSTALLLALGLVERRRTFALAAALGARPRQLAAFVWAEAGFIVLGGVACGVVIGWALSNMLVTVLTGVFDPPPAALAVPWGYLLATLGISILSMVAVVVRSSRSFRGSPAALMREI